MSRSSVTPPQLLDSDDEVVDAGAMGAVPPLAVVADAVDFVVEADGAACCYAGLQYLLVTAKIVCVCVCHEPGRVRE